MSEDKIIIDGVECEINIDPEHLCNLCIGLLNNDTVYIPIRRKRKQTGWICRHCELTGPCVVSHDTRPDGSAYSGCTSLVIKWEPFYGKVIE